MGREKRTSTGTASVAAGLGEKWIFYNKRSKTLNGNLAKELLLCFLSVH